MDTKQLVIVAVFLIGVVISIVSADDDSLNQNVRLKRAGTCHKPDRPLPPSMKTLRRQLAGAHGLKGFYPRVIGIVNVRERKRRRSKMHQIHTETLEEINQSSIEQERKTTEKSLDVAETQSIETSSMLEFSDNLEMGGNFGVSYFITAEGHMNVNKGHRRHKERSTTSSIARTVQFTMPSQTVVCPANSKVQLTWNIFKFTNTIYYLVDYELDREHSFFKPNPQFTFNFFHYVLRQDKEIARKLAGEDNCFKLGAFDYTKPFARAKKNEVTLRQVGKRLYLRNMPMKVKIGGHHGAFKTREVKLKKNHRG